MYNLSDNHKLFTQTVIDTINQTTNARKLYDVSVSELLVVKANYDLLSELLNVDYVSANLLDALATQVGTGRLPGESDADLKKENCYYCFKQIVKRDYPRIDKNHKSF